MGLSILLVEDEARIARFLVQGFSEEGYSVTHAPDGRRAWIELQRGSWDVVILDWWLPFLDGLELLKRFRRVDRRTPVILLTARDAISERVTGLDAGADDYVCKPLSFEELLARIRSLARRQQVASGLIFEYDDLQVDLRRQHVTRAGQPVELTAKAGKVRTTRNSNPAGSWLRVGEIEKHRRTTVKLVNRISALFLAAMLVALLGYSALPYLTVRFYLTQDFDGRLAAALQILTASIEVEPENVTWFPEEYTLDFEGRLLADARWLVADEDGKIVGQSERLETQSLRDSIVVQYGCTSHPRHEVR